MLVHLADGDNEDTDKQGEYFICNGCRCTLPSNHLHPLRGDRKGQWAISISGAWRLCFKFEEGDVFDVELVQYH
ncbi:MAG: type II toxin-antitoxin system RelE/ParE family toxin [Calditrichaceae bacterium]|nr:type II toxin-antitoxin system RelE/ParE family toxin [Calditrichaceae bacterium]